MSWVTLRAVRRDFTARCEHLEARKYGASGSRLMRWPTKAVSVSELLKSIGIWILFERLSMQSFGNRRCPDIKTQ